MSARDGTPRRVVTVYVTAAALGTFAASLIWGVNTLYLMDSGLSIFQVMLVNSCFSVGQILFEVPTGVIADTIGRKASYLFSLLTLIASTVLYVVAGESGWGMGGFIVASVALALGWTFQTGAVDAWLVDALDHVGFVGPKDPVFSKGAAAGGIAMLVGTMMGGLLGQIDLALPFVVRSVVLVVCVVFVAIWMRDWGFERRPLRVSTIGAEAGRIVRGGMRHGWGHPVVRMLLFQNLLVGMFFMFGFYSLQPMLLDLLGRQLIWVAAAVTALGSGAGILGNAMVSRVTRRGWRPGRVLAACAIAFAGSVLVAAVVGIAFADDPGPLPMLLVAGAWLVNSFVFGIEGPVRQAFINTHIPSKERATVLSLDALFGDAGGALGQPALGWLSQAASIPVAWLASSVLLFAGVPFYLRADKEAQREPEGTHIPPRPQAP